MDTIKGEFYLVKKSYGRIPIGTLVRCAESRVSNTNMASEIMYSEFVTRVSDRGVFHDCDGLTPKYAGYYIPTSYLKHLPHDNNYGRIIEEDGRKHGVIYYNTGDYFCIDLETESLRSSPEESFKAYSEVNSVYDGIWVSSDAISDLHQPEIESDNLSDKEEVIIKRPIIKLW